MMTDDRRARLDAYARFYETLTPERIGELSRHVAPDIYFRDPFNETRGIAAFERVLKKMFDDIAEPHFVIEHAALDGDVGYLNWRLRFRGKRRAAHEIVGVSELHFDAEGRIARHIDHWDVASQIYERVPLLGFVLRRIRRRLAA